MQMRERNYIRFDFTQALHARATTAERRDYRIIARTCASDHSLTRALAHDVHSDATPYAFTREASAQQPEQVCSSPGLPIYIRRLRESWLLVQEQLVALTNWSRARKTTRKATALAARSVSNRNGAHADRNRIFLGRRHHIFVAETLQQPTSPRESRRESSDSRRVIRLERQTPRRFLSASLTACGLALPPVDFIT
jgi:hypothetical protein